MAKIKGTQTEKNLLAAFAGESQARNRYTFYAEKAREEGYEQIASIFEETADNEKEHARRFFNFLKGGEIEISAAYPADIGDTQTNLEAAAKGENYEHETMYPNFAQVAEEEGFKEIARVFRMIARVEAEHEKRYLKLLSHLKNKKYFTQEQPVKWKCENCGYIHEGEKAPSICPACGYSQSYFGVVCLD
ncbi:MAG: rubrerythrin family protein [Candidatus Heimdallarchaeota archaeon]|nr:rubrerythrin family protein [Candidatus Heimdallarchaeota archaeon]